MNTIAADNGQQPIDDSTPGIPVTVGKRTMLFHPLEQGAVLRVPAKPLQVAERMRLVPVIARPQAPDGVLGREPEIEAARVALEAGLPVEIYGPPGVGKSALLATLANHAVAQGFSHGVIYVSHAAQPASDLIATLYETFWEIEGAHGPDEASVLEKLREKRALILLDNAELHRDELERVRNAMPGCTFAIASTDRRLRGEGRSLALHGLPPMLSQSLMEQELGRLMSTAEEDAVRDLSLAVGGNPLCLKIVAYLVKSGRSLEAEAIAAAGENPWEFLVGRLLISLREPEQRVMKALAAVRDSWVDHTHVAAVADVENPRALLSELKRRHLVRTAGELYSLSLSVCESVRRQWEIKPTLSRTLGYLTSAFRESRSEPRQALPRTGALLAVLEAAAEAGLFAEAVVLARAAEPALALCGRWGAWEYTVRAALEASMATGDLSAQAWATHQLGVRAICRGRAAEARRLLADAIYLFESTGNAAGLAVARSNLHLVAEGGKAHALSQTLKKRLPMTPRTRKLGVALAASLVFLVALQLMPRDKKPAVTAVPPANPPAAVQGKAALELAASAVDFGTVFLGRPVEQKVRLFNRGDADLVAPAVQVTSGESEFSLRAEGCELVKPKADCTLTVRFQPAEAGARGGAVAIRAANGQELKLNLAGTGVLAQPQLSVSHRELDFGELVSGNAGTARLRVTNVGTAPTTAVRVGMEPAAAPFAIAGNTCGQSLPVEGSCEVTVRFVSPAAPGPKQASLVITYDGSLRTPVTLVARAVAPPPPPPPPAATGPVATGQPAVQLSHLALDLGTHRVGARGEATLTVTNSGTAPLEMEGLFVSGQDFSVAENTCAGRSLPVGGTCSVGVRFSPTEGDRRTGALRLVHDAAPAVSVIELKGLGLARANLNLVQGSASFFDTPVGGVSVFHLEMTNAGPDPLVIRQVEATGAGFSVRSGNCTAAGLASGSACQVDLEFRPATAGEKSGTLTIWHNASEQPRTVVLRGVGTSR